MIHVTSFHALGMRMVLSVDTKEGLLGVATAYVTPATARRTQNTESPRDINNVLRPPHYKIIDVTNNISVYPLLLGRQ